MQVTAEFHRLNVLLMRVDDNELRQVSIAMKVATATLSDAKIEAHLSKEHLLKRRARKPFILFSCFSVRPARQWISGRSPVSGFDTGRAQT